MANLFDFKAVFQQIPQILVYLPTTIGLSVLSMAAATVLGLILAVLKMKKIPVVKQIVAVFISLIRGTPVIVQLYIAYFGIPMFQKYIALKNGSTYVGSNTNGFLYAVIALSINQSAYIAEIFRGALQSVGTGQIEAANALGMTNFQTLRRIILPETFALALPGLGNSFIGLLKGTSLAFACGVVEMTAEGKIIGSRDFRYFEVYVSLAIIYWALTIIVEQIIRLIENRIRIPEQVEVIDLSQKEEAAV
jgi:polar amino acid transport system permease protein